MIAPTAMLSFPRSGRQQAALAHQLAVQVRVLLERGPAMHPKMVVEDDEVADRERQLERRGRFLHRLGHVPEIDRLLDGLGTGELVDERDDPPVLVVEEGPVGDLLADVLRARRPVDDGPGTQRIVREPIEILPVRPGASGGIRHRGRSSRRTSS